MPTPDTLLAKALVNSGIPEDHATLVGHTEGACRMADVIVAKILPFLREALVCSEDELEAWRHAVWVGTWMHDWGKANDHFQRVFRDQGFRQGVRHETMSLVMACELDSWLAPVWGQLPFWARCAALFSASGHHLSFPDQKAGNRPGTSVTVYYGHRDFGQVLGLAKERYELGAVPLRHDKTYSLLIKGEVNKILNDFRRQLDLEFSEHEKRLIAAAKATVMAADLAASALPLRVTDPEAWIEERLGRTLETHQLQKVVEQRLKSSAPRPFQKQVQASDMRTLLVEAGCGTGKTAAAYLWCARHASGRRLFFCYPTTATASEGFAGYLADPDFEAILIHSRAATDYRLLENMPRPSREEIELREARLEALETWPIPAVVCTAHTVLGLMENVRRGIYAWPSLVRSVFVFDEVHAYSDRLFSYLLRFLQAFRGTPVLLMTASLQPTRKVQLELVCRERGGLETITGPREREVAPRYEVCKSDEQVAWDQALLAVKRGKRVLWVTNTVAKAMAMAERAEHDGVAILLYHARFRYRDRLKHHRTVVDAFQPGRPAVLAITTQVAEMSLDLSADLLVSEWAPIPAMIQRMGRLNRFAEIPSSVGTALFIRPDDMSPYRTGDPEEDTRMWTRAERWLDFLSQRGPVSQADLNDAFLELEKTDVEADARPASCEWLDGLWRTLRGRQAIEEAGYTVEVVRQEDVERGDPQECAIPMPIPPWRDWPNWRRAGRFPVAPAGTIEYDTKRGAKWKRN